MSDLPNLLRAAGERISQDRGAAIANYRRFSQAAQRYGQGLAAGNGHGPALVPKARLEQSIAQAQQEGAQEAGWIQGLSARTQRARAFQQGLRADLENHFQRELADYHTVANSDLAVQLMDLYA